MSYKDIISKIRGKDYYVKLLYKLKLNGLLDIFEDHSENIDYLKLITQLIVFLDKNKHYIKNFTTDKLENVIVLCIDEILTIKFKTEIDEEQIVLVMSLIKNTYFFKTIYKKIKDLTLKLYFRFRCNFCYGENDIDVVNIDKSTYSGQDNI